MHSRFIARVLSLLGLIAFTVTSASATTPPFAFFQGEGDATDSSSGHRDGTVPAVGSASVQYVPGKVGQAFHFDGTYNYLDFGDWFAFQSFTFGMWVKDGATAASPQVDQVTLADNHSNASFQQIWKIIYQSATQSYSYVGGDGGAPIAFALTPGSWQYLAVKRDGTNRVTKLFLDGKMVGSATGTKDIGYDFAAGMRFGANWDVLRHWKGDIDEIRFYDVALNDAEFAGTIDFSGVNLASVASVAGQDFSYTAGVGGSAGAVNVRLVSGTPSSIQTGSSPNSTGFYVLQSGDLTPMVLRFTFDAPRAFKITENETIASFEKNSFTLPSGEWMVLSSSDVTRSGSGPVIAFEGSTPNGGTPYGDFSIQGSGTTFDFQITNTAAVPTYGSAISIDVGTVPPDGGGLRAPEFTVNGGTQPFAVTPGGPIHLEAVQSSSPTGLSVRAQFSTTPTVEASWTDLADGRGGVLKPATAPSHYATDTTFYPAGAAVFFRAISSAPGLTDATSNVVGPFDLKQASLRIEESITSTSDPSGRIARAGDKLAVKLTFTNSGTATAKSLQVATLVPMYIPAQDTNRVQRQFVASDFDSISPGGRIVDVATLVGTGTQWVLPGGDVVSPVDGQGNVNKAIVWDVGDLDPNFQQFVAYTLNITNALLVPSAITRNNVYEVFSTINRPPLAPDEHTSNVANLGVDVRGPIRLTAVSSGTTVAPGGYITYTLKLENLGGSSAPNAAAVFTIPANTRFAGFGLDKKGLPNAKPAGSVRSVLVQHNGSSDELLLYIGKVAARKSATVSVTVQAQWAEPADVPNQRIDTIDYAGAFLNATAIRELLGAFANPTATSYVEFLKDPAHSVAAAFNDSGVVRIAFAGSTEHAPSLALLKVIADDNGTTLDDVQTEDLGNGDLLNTVESGHEITFVLAAINNGDSAAEDVYVQDRLPEGTVLVTGGNHPKPLSSTSSAAQLKAAVSLAYKSTSGQESKGDYSVTLEPDGRTLRIGGLHLDPHDGAALQFSVQVLTQGESAPPIGQILHAGASTIGSSSTPHTPAGFPVDTLVKVTGQASFRLSAVPLVPKPETSSNVEATANAMTAIYSQNPNALPLATGATAAGSAKFIPGAQRFYIHYENTSGAPASGVTLNFPTPANTVFYRAAAVNKGKVVPLPNGATVEQPAFLRAGKVSFHFNKLTAGTEGDVMVEVIVLATAVQAGGSLIPTTSFEIHDNTIVQTAAGRMAGPQTKGIFGGNHKQLATLRTIALADRTHVPKLGLMKVIPPTVKPGDNFDIQYVVMNHGDLACSDPIIQFQVPAGTQAISTTYGGVVTPLTGGQPGNTFLLLLASNGGPIMQNQPDRLAAHTAGAVTVTLKATGAAGTSITDDATFLIASYVGKIFTAPSSTAISNGGGLLGIDSAARMRLVQGVDFASVGAGVVVPLGGGNLVASGGGNLVASGGGNLVASGGGNLVATGGGNLIALQGVAGLGNTTGSGLLANLSRLVASGGGNIFNSGAGNLISQDGGGLISNDGGGIILQVSELVASGGGNIVASGGGNLVASGGGNLVASGGGNLVASGGGNLVASGGGNLITLGGGIVNAAGSLVASGGGNLVASGGGNLVASGGGNIAISLPSSSALVASGGGNLVASGGGNLVASGGGN